MNISLYKKGCAIICLMIFLILSSILPVVVGNQTILSNNKSITDKQIFYDNFYKHNQTSYGPLFEYKTNIKNKNIEKVKPSLFNEKQELIDRLLDAPWPMYCHDARHTSRSPYSTADTNGIEKWRFDTKDEITGSPVIDDQEIIYIAGWDTYSVYLNGTLKWKFMTWGWIQMTPAIDEDGVIYFGTRFADPDYLYAIHTSNGTLKWKYKIGNSQSSPTIGEDGIIYTGATDNWNIIALYQNGTRKWSFHAYEKIYSSPTIGQDGTIYFGSWDKHLYALYPNNGTLKWKYNTGGGIRTSPCIDDDGIIYTVSATNGNLNALYPNGTLKWKTFTNGGTSPTVGPDGTIYCGWTNLYAVSPEDGSIKWTYDPGPDRRIEEGTPCTSVEGTIYFGTHIGETEGGELIAVNPNGTECWRIMLATTWIMSAPAIDTNGTVYVGSFNDVPPSESWGYLHAIGPLNSNAPSAPEIDGSPSGRAGKKYDFTFKSTSPLDRDLYYWIEWGDGDKTGWIGAYSSGEEITESHTWSEKEIYTIKARAKDTDNLWGPWSYFEVEIPRKRISYNSFFLQLFNRYPFLDYLLNH